MKQKYRIEIWINGGAIREEWYTDNRRAFHKCVKSMKMRHTPIEGNASSVTLYEGNRVVYDFILTDAKSNCKRFYGERP